MYSSCNIFACILTSLTGVCALEIEFVCESLSSAIVTSSSSSEPNGSFNCRRVMRIGRGCCGCCCCCCCWFCNGARGGESLYYKWFIFWDGYFFLPALSTHLIRLNFNLKNINTSYNLSNWDNLFLYKDTCLISRRILLGKLLFGWGQYFSKKTFGACKNYVLHFFYAGRWSFFIEWVILVIYTQTEV